MYSSNQSRQLYVLDGTHKLTVETFQSVEHIGKFGVSIKYIDTDLSDIQLVDVFEDCDIRYISAKAAGPIYGRECSVSIETPPASATQAYFTIVAPGYYGDTLENKEVFPVNVTFPAGSSANYVASAFAAAINGSKTLSKHFVAQANNSALTIFEVLNAKEHVTGKYQVHSMLFYVENGHYIDEGVENHLSDAYTPSLWEEVVYTTSEKAGNSAPANTQLNGSYELAHLEWFCHGFRGDVYRGTAYPDDIPFTPLVKPSSNAEYYTCDIHYFWHGYGNQVDKSEKVLTFVGDETSMNALANLLSNISSAATQDITSSGFSKTPSFTLEDSTRTHNSDKGSDSFQFNLNNEVDGGVITASTEADWLTVKNPVNIGSGKKGMMTAYEYSVAYSYNANSSAEPRTAEIKVRYEVEASSGMKSLAEATFTVTQDGASSVY